MFSSKIQLKVRFFILLGCLILLDKWDNAAANPMFGENVRLARAGEFPFVVSIKHMHANNDRAENYHVCSGVLISSRDVLTVEHCLNRISVFNTEIIVGSHDIRQGVPYYIVWWQTYAYWTTIRHFAPRFVKNDIAIIRLRDNVTQVQPVALSPATNRQLYGSTVEVAGFGRTGTGATFNLMETVEMLIISRADCERRIRTVRPVNYKIYDKNICGIANPIALMSKGNSGAPVLHNGQLVGIHKGTCPSEIETNDPIKINLFMSIDYYRDYILDTLQNET